MTGSARRITLASPSPIPSRAAGSASEPGASRAPDRDLAAVGLRIGAGPVPMAVFLAMLASLLAVAGVSLFMPRTMVEGMPRDPSARAARDLLIGQVMPPGDGLRFRSAFLGELPSDGHPHLPDPALIARAEALLSRAREAHPLEPRVVAALGHLELARRHLERASRLYRHAIELRAHCSEARLGLGVALALESERSADAFRRRDLALEALAQFMAVPAESELALDALYDRAMLLARVGRAAEARRVAERYLALDPASPWAGRLRAEIESGARP